MARHGLISLDDFTVVDGRSDGSYRFRRTTPLYPEWFVMSRAAIDPGIATRVKEALLAMTPDVEAARIARINGFVEPLSLQGMKAAMGGLGISPLDTGNYRVEETIGSARQSTVPPTN